MRVKNLLVILIFICYGTCFSQINPEWVASFPVFAQSNGRVQSMCVDPAGNVYVLGTVEDSVDVTGWLIKYNTDGVQQWSNPIANVMSGKTKLDKDGNIYVVFMLIQPEDIITLKFNPNGLLQWYAQYNGAGNFIDQPRDIAFDDSLNVYVTGET